MSKLLFLPLLVVANLWAIELKTGDIILQPMSCYACRVISEETGSPFSHVGIIIKLKNQIYVAQALGAVKLSSFEKFLKQGSGKHLIRRSKSDINETQLIYDFENSFEGLAYDRHFLWDDQAIYCSELIYKILIKQGIALPDPKPMFFETNRDYWHRYFNGEPPYGEIGNSPGDFERSQDFETVGWY